MVSTKMATATMSVRRGLPMPMAARRAALASIAATHDIFRAQATWAAYSARGHPHVATAKPATPPRWWGRNELQPVRRTKAPRSSPG